MRSEVLMVPEGETPLASQEDERSPPQRAFYFLRENFILCANQIGWRLAIYFRGRPTHRHKFRRTPLPILFRTFEEGSECR